MTSSPPVWVSSRVLRLGVSVLTVGALTLAGCGSSADPIPAPTGPATVTAVGTVDPTAATTAFNPAEFVGVWKVSTPDVSDAGTLLVAPLMYSLITDCGNIEGQWVSLAGKFAASAYGAADLCDLPLDEDSWLSYASAMTGDTAGVTLVDANQKTVATLVPGDVPEEMAPLWTPAFLEELTSSAVEFFTTPAPLPQELHEPSATELQQKWYPQNHQGHDIPYIDFLTENRYEGSDGCNGAAGLWLLGPEGELQVAPPGAMTEMGCDNFPINQLLQQVRRVGMSTDGVLSWFDAEGILLQHFTTTAPEPSGAGP